MRFADAARLAWKRTYLGIAAAVIISVAFSPAPAAAWGEDGHWIVCELAYQQLSEEARKEVDRLVALHPDADTFAEGCHWPDRPRKRPREHYVNYARSVVDVGPLTESSTDPNVVTAIVEDVVRLGDVRLPDEERADALLFLGHWVGDVHQPMHVSFSDDRGGNSVDKRGTCRAGNLHAVWDTCIVQRGVMGLSAGESRLDGMRARARNRTVQRLQRFIMASDLALEPVDIVSWRMASESYHIVTSPAVGYCVRATPVGPCAYEQGNLTLDEGEPERTIVMDEDYVDRMGEVAEYQLLLAAMRLARLVGDAVVHEQ